MSEPINPASEPIEPQVIDAKAKAKEKDEDEIDLGPLFSYLQSVQGHEVVNRVLGMIEDVKKLTLEKHVDQAKHNRWLEASVIIFVVGAICVLSSFDKLTTPAGIALGTIVGYFFARSKS